MGVWFFTAIGEVDKEIIKEIAKEHKVSVELVEKHYKTMLEAIKNEK